MISDASARRNLRYYPWFVGGGAFLAWMPVFFLYFSARVSLADVLALEAIYYASVVVFEVPSGYFSDRVGRRPTLIISASALVLAYLAFGVASSFAGLAAGQVLLAVGLAFSSGTDTSFHLATLEALGDAESYATREAKIASLSLTVGALAALVGGALALVDLRLAYGASLAGAVVALAAALSFREVEGGPDQAPTSLLGTLRRCLRAASTPRLGWLFAAVVVATVVNHVPYEFYQPYLDGLEHAPWDPDNTPLVAGLHLALVQLVAVPAARGSAALARRFGPMPLILGASLLQLGLVVSMACWTSPWVAILLVGRSLPRALQDAPLRAAVAPYVAADLRATYLSLQSLVGRLGFSTLLVALSAAGDDLEGALRLAAIVAATLVALLLLTSPWARAPRS